MTAAMCLLKKKLIKKLKVEKKAKSRKHSPAKNWAKICLNCWLGGADDITIDKDCKLRLSMNLLLASFVSVNF